MLSSVLIPCQAQSSTFASTRCSIVASKMSFSLGLACFSTGLGCFLNSLKAVKRLRRALLSCKMKIPGFLTWATRCGCRSTKSCRALWVATWDNMPFLATSMSSDAKEEYFSISARPGRPLKWNRKRSLQDSAWLDKEFQEKTYHYLCGPSGAKSKSWNPMQTDLFQTMFGCFGGEA